MTFNNDLWTTKIMQRRVVRWRVNGKLRRTAMKVIPGFTAYTQENYEKQFAKLLILLFSPVSYFLLPFPTDILHRTLWPTVSLPRDQVSRQYKETNKIMFPRSVMRIFLGAKLKDKWLKTGWNQALAEFNQLLISAYFQVQFIVWFPEVFIAYIMQNT